MISEKEAVNIAKQEIGKEYELLIFKETEKYYIFARKRKDGRPTFDVGAMIIDRENGKVGSVGVYPNSYGSKLLKKSKDVDLSKYK